MCKHFLQLETYNNWNSVFDNLAKFLAKSNLVADGLTKFTDRAENYWAWRAFFCNAIEGLSLKPRWKVRCAHPVARRRLVQKRQTLYPSQQFSRGPTASLDTATERYSIPEAI